MKAQLILRLGRFDLLNMRLNKRKKLITETNISFYPDPQYMIWICYDHVELEKSGEVVVTNSDSILRDK